MNESGGIQSCEGCGVPLPSDAPDGLCPACLLGGGMPPTVKMPQRGPRVSSGGQEFEAPTVEAMDAYVPNCDVSGVIGAGGMGVVYKGRQPQLDREVAIKLLPKEIAEDDPQFAERFQLEARTMARLGHPSIVQVYDSDRTGGGHFYFVMEYVEGFDLRRMIRQGGIAPADALDMALQICGALEFAHGKGIVHRDIKPGNILVDGDGNLKVTDFGLAKILGTDTSVYGLTMTGSAMGTPHYVAPEQADPDQTADHRADIYSLGVVLYELLTGQVPDRNYLPPSELPGVDPRLDAVLEKAMSTDPAARYQTISELKNDLSEIATTHRLRTRVLWNAGVGVVAIVMAMLVSQTPFALRMDHLVHDWWFAHRSPIPVSDELVIATITNKCLEEYGRWPWDRARHGALISKLDAAGAEAIALDILFSESTPSDNVLAAATEASGNVVYGMSFLDAQPGDGIRWTAGEVLRPEPVFEAAAAATGHTTADPETDGGLRRIPLFVRDGDRDVPTLGLAMVMEHLEITHDNLAGHDRHVSLRRNDGSVLAIPVDSQGRLIVSYPRSLDRFKAMRYSDLLDSEHDLDGNCLLVGMWAEGLTDQHATPVSPITPGVFVHAAVANSLLTGEFVRETGSTTRWILLVVVVGLMVAAFLHPRPLLGGLVALGLLVSLIALGFEVFNASGVLCRIFPLAVGIVAAWGGLMLLRVFAVRRGGAR